MTLYIGNSDMYPHCRIQPGNEGIFMHHSAENDSPMNGPHTRGHICG